jgi:hypothetical protein
LDNGLLLRETEFLVSGIKYENKLEFKIFEYVLGLTVLVNAQASCKSMNRINQNNGAYLGSWYHTMLVWQAEKLSFWGWSNSQSHLLVVP